MLAFYRFSTNRTLFRNTVCRNISKLTITRLVLLLGFLKYRFFKRFQGGTKWVNLCRNMLEFVDVGQRNFCFLEGDIMTKRCFRVTWSKHRVSCPCFCSARIFQSFSCTFHGAIRPVVLIQVRQYRSDRSRWSAFITQDVHEINGWSRSCRTGMGFQSKWNRYTGVAQ